MAKKIYKGTNPGMIALEEKLNKVTTPQVKAIKGMTPLGIKPTSPDKAARAQAVADVLDKPAKAPKAAKPTMEDRLTKAETALKAAKALRPVAQGPLKDIRPMPRQPLKNPIVAEKAPKAAKPGKAPKTAAAPAKVQTITVLNKENPHEAGSNRAKQFALVLKSKDTAAYAAAGGKAKYLPRWSKAGLIKLA